MIEVLISSKTRIKLLLKFFLNSKTTTYLRSLESEFGESSNGIRLELNRLEKAGLLSSEHMGNRKYFKANTGHPLFDEIHNILLKHLGIDQITEKVIERLGAVEEVYLTGDFSKGKDSEIIDLIIMGRPDKEYLVHLVDKVEQLIHRKIRFLLFENRSDKAMLKILKDDAPLLLWSAKV
ncbi:MAG: ArsR family transcriptional regulator [Saprospiraceae bacterium]|nr:ArsR family transcriptional regulator [Saprospiraceae bacterium]